MITFVSEAKGKMVFPLLRFWVLVCVIVHFWYHAYLC